ncbi:MAG: hypothetical protein WDN45_08580 [Caulobacteraceae bacterium]
MAPPAPAADPIGATLAAAPALPDQAPPTKAEPAMVKALMEQKPAPAPAALTPEENAFFAVLGRRVTDAASAYETYVRRATAIDSRFGDAAAVQRAVKAGAAYQPQQLQEGIVAYAALLALRDDAFVDGVKGQRDPSFADRLIASPRRCFRCAAPTRPPPMSPGHCAPRAPPCWPPARPSPRPPMTCRPRTGPRLPCSIPRACWPTPRRPPPSPRAATVPAKQRLLDSLVAAPQAPVGADGAGAPDVVRGLALAALAIMGRTGDDKEAVFEALLHDATSADCLKMAKLNLNQCLAVAGPHYEDVYCTGRHAVGETAQCVSAAANGLGPPLAPPIPLMQRADAYGPEQAKAYGQRGLDPVDKDDDDTPQRYAAAAPPAYVPPAAPSRAPAPAPAYPDTRQTYAQNDQAYTQAPYQDPRAYAPPQAQYQPPQYQQPQAPQPQYQQPAYPAPQQSYPGQPYSQYPYGYASRGYYGQ